MKILYGMFARFHRCPLFLFVKCQSARVLNTILGAVVPALDDCLYFGVLLCFVLLGFDFTHRYFTGVNFTEDERKNMAAVIYNNIILSMKYLIQACEDFDFGTPIENSVGAHDWAQCNNSLTGISELFDFRT